MIVLLISPLRLMVRTSPFQGKDTGSIPVGDNSSKRPLGGWGQPPQTMMLVKNIVPINIVDCIF